VGRELGRKKWDFENRGYKCGYFWQICGGFRVFGSGHTGFSNTDDSAMGKTGFSKKIQR